MMSLSLLSAAGAWAEDNPWIPAFAGHGGIAFQLAEATATTSSAQRNDASGDQQLLLPSLGLSAELMTPKAEVPGGQLSAFFRGGVDFGFAPGWSVAKDRDPGPVRIPLTPIGTPAPPGNAKGVGMVAQVESPLASFNAGIGAALEFPLGERTLRLRPSVEYRFDELGYRLRLSDAESLALDGNCDCGIAQLSTRGQQSFHLLGPGLELEMDAARAGPMMLTVFASFRGYRVLTERKERLRLSGAYTPSIPAAEPLTAEAKFDREPWTFQGGVGLRFRWLPE